MEPHQVYHTHPSTCLRLWLLGKEVEVAFLTRAARPRAQGRGADLLRSRSAAGCGGTWLPTLEMGNVGVRRLHLQSPWDNVVIVNLFACMSP